MLRKAFMVSVLGLLGLICFSSAGAQEKNAATSKATEYTSAATIDFSAKRGIASPSLQNIGDRIESARRAPDPAGLAAAANELAAAEKVSGKKASLTADKLRKEAVQAALLRANSAELKLVNELVQNSADKKQLTGAIADAEKAEKKLAGDGETPRGIVNSLSVKNFSIQWVSVYVNAGYVGRVPPRSQQTFFGHNPSFQVQLTAYGDLGSYWVHTFSGDILNPVWTIQ